MVNKMAEHPAAKMSFHSWAGTPQEAECWNCGNTSTWSEEYGTLCCDCLQLVASDNVKGFWIRSKRAGPDSWYNNPLRPCTVESCGTVTYQTAGGKPICGACVHLAARMGIDILVDD